MIKRIKRLIETQTTLLMKKAGTFKEEDAEYLIDEEEVKCEDLEAPVFECGPGHLTQGYGFFGHTGVPAPKVLKEDEWFGSAPVSDANMDYMEREYEAFKQDAMNYYGSETKESDNIHQVMYDIATSNNSTTLQLNPIGGSENYHEKNDRRSS